MKVKKGICCIVVIILIVMSLLPQMVFADSSKDYALLIGDKDSNYTLYENLIVLTSNDEIMLKAEPLCKILNFSYSYNKTTKKIKIKNKDNGKTLEYTVGSKQYVYYSGTSAKGSKKTAKYKCYYDSKSKSYLIHYDTLNYLINCKYFLLLDYNIYTKMGYEQFIFISKYDSLDTLPMPQKEIKSIPTYETNGDTYIAKNFLGSITYKKYTSYGILYDIERSRGIYSDGTSGLWYQVFYMLGYDDFSVPSIVDCWKDPNGRIAFILPNGNIYMDDACYAVLVANNIEEEEVRESFFYDIVDLKQLAAYIATYGPADVSNFIRRWYAAEEKKQDAINKWLDSWDYGPRY